MKNTIDTVAACGRQICTNGLFHAIFLGAALTACTGLPAPAQRPLMYDFGPAASPAAPLLAPAAAPAATPAAAPSVATPSAAAPSATPSATAALPPLALAEVQAGGLTDGSSAVLYRLAYANALQLRPYTLARWSQPPAQLVQQRLRAELGQRRALLDANDAAALSAPRPAVLRVELEEFSQVFQTPSDSVGLLRLRATLVEPRPAGVTLLGQHVFSITRPAQSPDAAGGTRALAEAAQQAAQEIDAWLRQWER